MKASTVVAKARTVTRSRALPISDACLGQISEKIEGAGDEHRPELAGAGERDGGVGLGLDVREMRSREPRELIGGKRARVRRLGGDEPLRDRGELSEHRVDVLVAEDRGADHIVRWGKPAHQPRRTLGVVSPVPDLVFAAALEPAGKRDLDLVLECPADECARGQLPWTT